MSQSARLVVDPPVFIASPYGLLSTVDMRAETDGHWQMGITWEDICGGMGVTLDACTTSAPAITGSGSIQAKAKTTSRSLWGATPFTVFAEVDCSPPDFWENREATMQMALNRFESFQVERTFWTGLAPERNSASGTVNGVLPHLAAAAGDVIKDNLTGYSVTLQQQATIVTGAALNVVDALGALEGALAACLNGTGIIHVPQALAPTLALLLTRQGNRLLTPNGNIVAIGAGYPGTSPFGVAPALGTAWMYATGPIFGYRSAPTMRLMDGAAPLDRSVDTVKAIIERTYVLGYDCCLFAQLVNTASFIATSTTTP
jgi:hypothetical protein